MSDELIEFSVEISLTVETTADIGRVEQESSISTIQEFEVTL